MDSDHVSPEVLERAGLRLEVDGPVTTVTLDRPRTKNAQTPATWLALRTIGAHLPSGTRVVVVQATGDTFSSGLDLRMLAPPKSDGQAAEGLGADVPGAAVHGGDVPGANVPGGEVSGAEVPGGRRGERSLLDLLALSDTALADTVGTYQDGFTWLRRAEIVSVAAVQGHAVGAGFQLALACDLRVLADDAALSMREPLLGLVPDLTGTKPLVELVGYSRALEICATGRSVSAAEAREIGLATAVVPGAELRQTVADLVEALTAAPYGAVTETKALLQSATRVELDVQRRLEREAQVRRFRELASLMGED